MFGSSKGALEPHSITVLAISKMKNKSGTVSLKNLNYLTLKFGILIFWNKVGHYHTENPRKLEKVFKK